MFLVVGLGNPGPKYAGNRHNVGFMVVDALASDRAVDFRDKFNGEFAKADGVALLKPMTFMNLSGNSVQRAMQFFKVPLTQVLVIHDELDLEFGDCRIKVGGGLAGHNGLRSIAQQCGGQAFVRIRFGVGRPKHRGADHVLSDFNSSERAELGDHVRGCAEMAKSVVDLGPREAMNRHHGKAG